ncbi:MAG: glutaredoxin 3 [Alphaproteobacteria bacterium]|nr:glutaredoxin 3 [Alphaproteobacteria bacterium]
MSKVEIYTAATCPYCARAKKLLDMKGVSYEEHRLSFSDADAMAKMSARADGRRTVPQIFIDGKGIGGCDDLYALDSEGKLDGMLAA